MVPLVMCDTSIRSLNTIIVALKGWLLLGMQSHSP